MITNKTNTSFGQLQQVDAGVLIVGYAEDGPASGPAVVLLHGWPYDIFSYVDVVPLLASAGYRVIVPYLRGFGATRFLSKDTVRNGQQSALAVDAIALMDALKIEKAVVAGFNWGARTADILAALWPERCKSLVSVSGYLIGSQASNQKPLPPQAELQWWYQFYEDFVKHFAADVDPKKANVMYVVQQPILMSSFGQVMGEPAWKTLPSWYLVTKNDQAIAPDLERFFARRMGATTVETDSSHVAMVSHPDFVTDLIIRASEAVTERMR